MFCSSLALLLLVIGGNEARPQYLQSSICDASWSTGACILSSSSEHHIRNDSSSSTSWSHDSHVFFHSRTLVVPGTFLRVVYNNVHHHVAFARELEEKEKHTEQDQPAVRSAVAAAAAAEVRFSMTCRFVDGQRKRGKVHIPAIMSFAFPDVVVFDGFI